MKTDATFDDKPEDSLDYQMTMLAGSRLQVRGPLPSFDEPYIAVLGGKETLGKYVEAPFASLLADWTGMPVANLGVAQAGLSLFSEEQVLLDIASKAELTVLQVLGAQNMSNRLYSVHSRRNDRFLGVSPALREMFPQVDFAEINFTGHLIGTLRDTNGASFDVLVDELKWAWIQRMRRVLSLIQGDVILLWISDRGVDAPNTIESEPHFVDRAMLAELNGSICSLVEVVLGHEPSLEGKVFQSREADAAIKMPGPSDHHRIAEQLLPSVTEWFGAPSRTDGAARRNFTAFR